MNPWWKKNGDDDANSDGPAPEANNDETPTENNDAASDDKAEAKADDSEEKKPTRRRRAPKKKAAADDDASDAQDDEEKKKPTRRSPAKKKSAKSDDDEADAQDDDSDGEEEEEEEKPRSRRRSPRKRASKSTAARDKSDEKEDNDDETAKPSRRRRGSRGGRGRSSSGESASLVEASPAAAPEPTDLLDLLRDSISDSPQPTTSRERRIALFFDFENIALGIKESDIPKFDVDLVLERLLEKGRIIVKKAYADWERYSDFKKSLHSAAIELIEIPQKYYSGKNSADIKMVVDAMELSATNEHIDSFVILSGDSDFSPLVSKLREHNKYVLGVGVKNSSSKLLIDNCDEFIFYEDIWRDSQQAPKLQGLDKKKTEVFSLMTDAIKALIRENKDVLWGSMIKQTMQRKRPSFNEGYYGYGSFSELLEEAEERKMVNLKKDHRSGSYIVTGFGRSN